MFAPFLPLLVQLYVPVDFVRVGGGVDVVWFGDGDGDGVGSGIDDSVGESCPLLYLCSAGYKE